MYGIDEQHTKKSALPGAAIFRGGTMYPPPRATHNNLYPGTGRVNYSSTVPLISIIKLQFRNNPSPYQDLTNFLASLLV